MIFMKKKDWYDRFLLLIKESERPMRDISVAAGCGENYVQQFVGAGKPSKIDKFIRILNELGLPASVYVLTGFKINPDDLAFLDILSSSDARKKEAILSLLREESSPK